MMPAVRGPGLLQATPHSRLHFEQLKRPRRKIGDEPLGIT